MDLQFSPIFTIFLHFSLSLLFSSICDVGYYCKGWWEPLTLPVIFFTWVRGRKFHLHVPQYVSVYLSHGYLENALVLSRSHSHFIRNCLIITRLYYHLLPTVWIFSYNLMHDMTLKVLKTVIEQDKAMAYDHKWSFSSQFFIFPNFFLIQLCLDYVNFLVNFSFFPNFFLIQFCFDF